MRAKAQRRTAVQASPFAYDPDNSLAKSWPSDNDTEAAATYFTYDETGALTEIAYPGSTVSFAYNAANLVESLVTPDHTTYFHYDGNLQRYCVEEDGTATYYVWDGLRLLETRNADGSLKARFTHGLARIEGIGSCVEVYRASDAKRFYMLYDHRGSAHVLLDESKTVVATRLYNAFGEMISQTGSWPSEVPFAYQTNWLALPGMVLPDGTQLYLSPTRVYHPGVGRFLQRDMAGIDINLYPYVGNGPPNATDPFGLQPEYEYHHLVPVWFAQYSVRAHGLRIALEHGVHVAVHHGRYGIEGVRRLWQSGAITSAGAYGRVIAYQAMNIGNILRSSRAAHHAGRSTFLFSGGGSALLAQFGVTPAMLKAAAMSAAGFALVGVAVGGGLYGYTKLIELETAAAAMEADIEFWNKYCALGQNIGRQHAAAVRSEVMALFNCPQECEERVQDVLDEFTNLVGNKFGWLQAAQYAGALTVRIQEARLITMQSAVARLMSDLENKANCRPRLELAGLPVAP
jgi:RHS repeat-associated protein